MVSVTRTSYLTGITRTIHLDISKRVYYDGMERWQIDGELIQDAFPFLSPDEREFIKSGITPEEWNHFYRDV